MDPVQKYLIDGLKARTPSPEVIRARSDSNFFCEWCFQDDQKGTQIVQAPHHRLWHQVTEDHRKAVMWFPIEHGKSTQAKFKLCRLLGQHPERQYAYLSSKGKQARKMVKAVKGEIESNERLQMVYPKLKPQKEELSNSLLEWGSTSIRVDGCPRGSRDSSLVGYGLDGDILGSRLHGIIIDNVLDSANTNTDDLREKTIDRLKDEILGRVMKGGFIWFLDTAWFHDDALHYYAQQPGWHSVKLDAEKPLQDGDETLWPAQFDRKRLDEKRDEELGQTAYDRQFRNQPLSETMDFFKREFWDLAYGRVPWVDSWDEGTDGFDLQAELRTGVDLATKPGESHDLTVFSSVMAAGHRRRLINMDADRMSIMDILARFVAIYRTLHRPINLAGGNAKFVVEDNAQQVYVVDMLKSAATLRNLGLTPDEVSDIRVTGRTTTSKRRDQELGIPMLASGLEMGRWDIAPHSETRQLREEMRVWSPDMKHYGDRVMATWFAASDLRETTGGFRVINV